MLWALLNGEAFDYIGSQRVAFDLQRGAWPPDAPLSPSDINLHVEVGQIGGSLLEFKESASWPLYSYVHTDNVAVPKVSTYVYVSWIHSFIYLYLCESR